MIARNPEFVRNLWLELTPMRLVMMPLLLVLVFVIAGQGSGRDDSSANTALTLFLIVTVCWGSKLAADALLDYVQDLVAATRSGRWFVQGLSPRAGLAVLRALGLPDDDARVNAWGGAIALGHPLGASGARLATTAINQLHRSGGRYALCTMCIGVGQGIAVILERV